MQFKTTKQLLLKAILKVNGAVEKKNSLDILHNIKISANDNSVSLTATDMDIAISSNFNIEDVTVGSTTVNAKIFLDIISKISDSSSIIINQENDLLIIKSGKSKYKIPCLSAEDFPCFPEVDGKQIEVEAKTLLKMIDKTKFAICNDETRHVINGIFLQIVANENDKYQLKTVATDGHRLSLSFNDIESTDSFGIIIPKRVIPEIRKIIESENKILINISDVKISIKTNDATLTSKLIDGEFPQYDRVIPENNNKIAKINKKLIIESIERVAIVATDKHNSIKLSFTNNKLILEANSRESGSAYEDIDIEYSGDNIEIGFNARYLIDIISQIDKNEFIIKFNNETSAVIIEAEGLQSLFVIMPIRV